MKITEKTGKIVNVIQSLPFRSKSINQTVKKDDDMDEPTEDGAVDDDDREQKLSVTDALDQLQKQIKSFQEEVDMCESERLGRVERDAGDLKRGLVFVANQNRRKYPRECSIYFGLGFPYLTSPDSGRHEIHHRHFHEETRGIHFRQPKRDSRDASCVLRGRLVPILRQQSKF